MEAEGWKGFTELLANTAWTSQDLEEKHGVSTIELFLWSITRDKLILVFDVIPFHTLHNVYR